MGIRRFVQIGVRTFLLLFGIFFLKNGKEKICQIMTFFYWGNDYPAAKQESTGGIWG